MNVVALWRDGSVFKPEARHFKGGYVTVRFKRDESVGCFSKSNSDWSKVHWLDNTLPTELTPQEAFECLKLTSPNLENIVKLKDKDWQWGDGYVEGNVNWGNLDRYPPKPKVLRLATKDDAGRDVVKVGTGVTLVDVKLGAKIIIYDEDGFLVKFADKSTCYYPECMVEE